MYYSLVNLRTDLTKCLLGPLRIFFSYDINIKITVDPLLDDFRSNNIVFLFFPSLSSCVEISLRFIHYIPNLFLLKNYLGKVDPLRPVLKAVELLSLAFAIIVRVSDFADLDDLVEGKNVIFARMHTPDLII